MNVLPKVICEKICVLMKAAFRRHTLCISRRADKIRAQIIRKAPRARHPALATKKERRSCVEQIPDDPIITCMQETGFPPWIKGGRK